MITLIVIVGVWALCGLRAYQLDFKFWSSHFNYDGKDVDSRRLISNRAMTSAILGPIGLADCLMANFRKTRNKF